MDFHVNVLFQLAIIRFLILLSKQQQKKIPSQADGEFKLTVNIGGSSGQVDCINFHFKLKD